MPPMVAVLPFKRVGDAWEGDHRRVAWFTLPGCPTSVSIPVGTGMSLPEHLRRNWCGELDLPTFMVVERFLHVQGGAIVMCGQQAGVPVAACFEEPGAVVMMAAHDLERAAWN